MGVEYRFTITERDLSTLSNQIEINTLDRLLRNAPHYIECSNDEYRYKEDPKNDQEWASTVTVDGSGMLLCYYSSWGSELLKYLCDELLDKCGRLEVEDE